MADYFAVALFTAGVCVWAFWPAWLERRDTKRRNALRRARIAQSYARPRAVKLGDGLIEIRWPEDDR